MKTLEMFDAFLREGIGNECAGIVAGEQLIKAGPARYFGINETGHEIKANCNYLWYYGTKDEYFCFLPKEHIEWQGENNEVLYLFEMED